MYDPVTGNWTLTRKMKSSRYQHTESMLKNGKVLLIGGVKSGIMSINSTELYNPLTRTWTKARNIQRRY